jgi:protocatechuate 3,4-dioxygenase beta subunit
MKRPFWSTSILSVTSMSLLYRLAHGTGRFRSDALISRRTLMKLGALAGPALFGNLWRNRVPAVAAGTTTISPEIQCVLAPEQTQGPYYIAREKVRSNIAEHKPGVPLKLRLAVVDAATCKPIKGAIVDIWHCDAGGVYSGFQSASTGGAPGGSGGPTDHATFLRGIQRTNAHGLCEFTTVYPGWYRGRTVHIHVMVHVGGQVVHTGQLYFSDSLTAKVYRRSPYSLRTAARDTFNATDGIYANGGSRSMLSLKHSGSGYIGSISMGVHRS